MDHQASVVEHVEVSILEAELEARKAALQIAKVDLQNRFIAFAEEQEAVAILERALAKAHRLL